MLLSSKLIFAALFAELPLNIFGSCLTSDKVCEDYSGVCTKPLNTFLDSFNGPATERRDIWNVLSYGHYCGASTKCVAANLEKGGKGLGPEPPAPCNDIDSACMQHDACLDGLKAENGNNPRIGFPLRCKCELNIVGGMWNATLARADGKDHGQLCDAEFYDLPIVDALGMDEEDFLAVPFCFLIFDGCGGETDLLAEYEAELAYCSELIEKLSPPPAI
jgi:hypothetical protein